jgi:flagellin
MLSINTNVGSLQAAKASYSVNKSMETSMERLSTGKRINGAHDDAAGLQISMRMTAEIQGLNQSIRNAADGQSLLATAEGAMEEIQIILLRIRELAVQSANGTNATADRNALQSEAAALEAEISRIADNTTWAGVSLINGDLSIGLDALIGFQVGPDATQIITHTIPDMSATAATVNLVAALTIGTYTGAMSMIIEVDKAISAVGTEREQIGAVMNRLDHTIANLENVSMNLTLSKGRIEDADFAAESANLARTQVLQQASMAMLSQANASKQNILSLFQ